MQFYHLPTMKDVAEFYVRMPGTLAAELQDEAKRNFRSRNAELVARLDESLHPTRKSLMNYEAGDLVGELLRRYPPDQIMIRIGKE